MNDDSPEFGNLAPIHTETPDNDPLLKELESTPENLAEVDKHVRRRHLEATQDLMLLHGIDIVNKKEFAIADALEKTNIEINGERDSLTGLRNRNGLQRALEDIASANKRLRIEDRGKAIFIRADANGLRDINNKLGHKAGDEFLKEFGIAFEKARGHDIAARDGGDEFGIILMNTDFDGAAAFWNRVNEALPNGHSIVAGVSQLDFDDIEGSMHNADLEMYKAKTKSKDNTEGNEDYGKNIISFPDSTQNTKAG